jgi:hypothetical protein
LTLVRRNKVHVGITGYNVVCSYVYVNALRVKVNHTLRNGHREGPPATSTDQIVQRNVLVCMHLLLVDGVNKLLLP